MEWVFTFLRLAHPVVFYGALGWTTDFCEQKWSWKYQLETTSWILGFRQSSISTWFLCSIRYKQDVDGKGQQKPEQLCLILVRLKRQTPVSPLSKNLDRHRTEFFGRKTRQGQNMDRQRLVQCLDSKARNLWETEYLESGLSQSDFWPSTFNFELDLK